MPDNRTCGECGTELPANAPRGLCPRCLAGMGLRLLPTQESPASHPAVERPGTRIGRHQLGRKIGEGGLSVVFVAEPVEPGQGKVALKIIKAGIDSRTAVARFEAERQAIALMDHPGIPRVLEAGTTEAGRPYYVMELVRGVPITEYCDQNYRSIDERLGLFVKVCEAVQHAHQKGFVLRMLKPGNVLVTLQDGKPVTKVIDFSAARELRLQPAEKALSPGFQHLIGVPAYMSPEQAVWGGLDFDIREDIYSLGVLLYELLTGVTPLDPEAICQASPDEIRRMIQVNEPLRPSMRLRTLGSKLPEVAGRRGAKPAALRRLLSGNLDGIVMRCLEKDRQRRYETVNGLVVDIQRHRDGELITADPSSKLRWFQKLAWWSRLPLVVGGAIIATLVVGPDVAR